MNQDHHKSASTQPYQSTPEARRIGAQVERVDRQAGLTEQEREQAYRVAIKQAIANQLQEMSRG